MRVLVCGSRRWLKPRLIWDEIEAIADADPNAVIIEGGAWGADRMAESAARALGLEVIEEGITALDWEQYGKGAGPVRNARMLIHGPDRVIAFRRHGNSRGTDDMIRQSLTARLPVTIIYENGERREL